MTPRFKLRSISSVAMAVLICLGLAAAPASADNYVTLFSPGIPDHPSNKPDNFEHTYCLAPSIQNQGLIDAAVYAMNNLDAQTRYFDNFRASCTWQTDVVWIESTAIGQTIRGMYACQVLDESGNECDRAYIWLNPNLLTDAMNERKTACHELGHSAGLQHAPAGGGTGCMVSGAVTQATETYVPHHVVHMDQSQEDPFGFADLIQRVPGGIRVAGWMIDPDLRLNATQVHVYVDGAGYNLGWANGNRTDVGDVYPYWGDNHGFDASFSIAGSNQDVCVWAWDVEGTPGDSQLLRCQFTP